MVPDNIFENIQKFLKNAKLRISLLELNETFLLIFNHYAIENFTLNLNFSVHVEFG